MKTYFDFTKHTMQPNQRVLGVPVTNGVSYHGVAAINVELDEPKWNIIKVIHDENSNEIEIILKDGLKWSDKETSF